MRKQKYAQSFVTFLLRKSFVVFVLFTLLFPNFSQPAKAVSLDLDPQTKTETIAPIPDTTKDEQQLIETQVKLNENAKNISVPFIKNEGQIESERVKFYANIFTGGFYVTENGFRYAITKKEEEPKTQISNQLDRQKLEDERRSRFIHKFSFDEQLLDKNNQPINFSSEGDGKSDINVTYFQSENDQSRKINTENYNQLNLGEVWNNINVRLKAYGSNIEKIILC